MAATSIYGIDYPANTDLVTNGAAQMQLLAGDVETALQNQMLAVNTLARNTVLNPTFSMNSRPAATTSIADYWNYYVDAIAGVTNTRSTLAITATVPEWVTYQMTNTVASNAAGIARYVAHQTLIPGVRNLSNATVVVSFYAKAAVAGAKVGVNLTQYFGTGGAPSASVEGTGQAVTLTTSYARYSLTFTVASVSGKTIGTNADDGTYLRLWTSAGSNYNTQTGSIGLQTATIDITGVQVERNYLTPLEVRPDNSSWLNASTAGQWASWTPQLKQGAAGLATTVNYAGYTLLGKTCIAQCSVTAGANGTAASALQILSNGTLPNARNSLTAGTGMLLYDDIGTGLRVYMARITSPTSQPYWQFYLDSATTSAVAPTIATNDVAHLTVTYEVA